MLLQAAVYFNKIQCFCFEEQRLLPGEQIDMPVLLSFALLFDELPCNVKLKAFGGVI